MGIYNSQLRNQALGAYRSGNTKQTKTHYHQYPQQKQRKNNEAKQK